MATPAEIGPIAKALGLSPAEIEYELAHLDETKEPSIMAAVGTVSALATISVLLRIWVRRRKKNKFLADDHAIFVALILSWTNFVAIYYQTHKGGLGLHVLATTPEIGRIEFITFFVSSGLLILCQFFTQISFLFLYKRVFTTYRAWFRYTLYVIAFLVLTSNLSVFLAWMFQCKPIQKAWKYRALGHCIKVRRMYVVHAALTLVIDVGIVVAPMPVIWTLHADRTYKMAVGGMFLLGSLVCIINGIKIQYLNTPPRGDISFNDIGPTIWCHAQLCLGIVGANLPLLKPLFRILHEVISTRGRSSSTKTTTQSTRKIQASADDSYKKLEGKEPSLTESDIALVPREQWAATPSFPGQSSRGHTKSTIEARPPLPKDVEQGLSINEIGVVREVDVSSSQVK